MNRCACSIVVLLGMAACGGDEFAPGPDAGGGQAGTAGDAGAPSGGFGGTGGIGGTGGAIGGAGGAPGGAGGAAGGGPPTVIWARKFGGPGSSFVSELAPDPSGNIVIAGHFSATIAFDHPMVSAGESDIFLAKLDSGGNPFWSDFFGGAENDMVTAGIGIDGFGQVYFGGIFWDSLDFRSPSPPFPRPMDGNPDGYFARLASNNQIDVAISMDGLHSQFPTTIALADDDFLCGGYFGHHTALDGEPLPHADGEDGFLGRVLGDNWAFRIGDLGKQKILDMAILDTELVAIGEAEGTVELLDGSHCTSAGETDVILVRVDWTTGDLISVECFGGSSSDSGTEVAFTADGGVVMAGTFRGSVDFGTGQEISRGEQDIFLVKLDPQGEPAWTQTFGGLGNEVPWTLAVHPNGNIYLGGLIHSPTDFGGGELQPVGNADGFLASFSAGGDHIWSTSFGDVGVDRLDSVAVAANGEILAGGSFEGSIQIGDEIFISDGMGDIFVARFAP